MAVLIEIDGKTTDVTSCANSKCGEKPIKPTSSNIIERNRIDREHRENMRDYFTCVNSKCGGKKVKFSTTYIGSSRPPRNIGEEMNDGEINEEMNDGEINDRLSEKEEQENWFSKNKNILLIGTGLVLIGGGVLLYFRRKK